MTLRGLRRWADKRHRSTSTQAEDAVGVQADPAVPDREWIATRLFCGRQNVIEADRTRYGRIGVGTQFGEHQPRVGYSGSSIERP